MSSLHALADYGNDRLIVFLIERGQAVAELEPEFLSDRLRGRCGFARVHCKTNRMLGGLRTEDDVHFMRRQGPEQPFGGPAVADLAASSQREEGQVAHRADALGQPIAIGWFARDERSARRWIEAVLDHDRDRFGDGRPDRAG